MGTVMFVTCSALFQSGGAGSALLRAERSEQWVADWGLLPVPCVMTAGCPDRVSHGVYRWVMTAYFPGKKPVIVLGCWFC